MPLPEIWQKRIEQIKAKNFDMGFSRAKRIWPDKNVGACTGAALEEYLHYSQPRTLTHREIARFMGYPDTWLIEPMMNNRSLGKTWGKGVTVDCGRWLGEWTRASLDGSPGTITGEQIGDREFLIDHRNEYKKVQKSLLS